MSLNGFILLAVFLPWVSGLIIWTAGKRYENYGSFISVLISLSVLIGAVCLYPIVYDGNASVIIKGFFMGEILFRITPLGYIFILLTPLVWLAASILSISYMGDSCRKSRFYCFFLLTLGSTMGVFLSGDMIILFTFFEIMSLTSFVLVIHEQHEKAIEAGKLYIYMSVFGGLMILMGLFMLYYRTGTLQIQDLYNVLSTMGREKYSIYFLITLGFGVKAGMVPFHIWLPKAYPAAPFPASAILSGVLAKTGIYGILLSSHIFLGSDGAAGNLLVVLGAVTMLSGGMQALKNDNLKGVLAYSSMSQMGYVILSIGIALAMGREGWISYAGAIYQAVNHGLYETMLFLAAGYLHLITGTVQLNKLKGLGREIPLSITIIFIGLAAMSGMPGLNGFVGKTLIHEGIVEAYHFTHHYMYSIYEWIYVLGSSFTAAYCFKIVLMLMDKGKEKVEIKKQGLSKAVPAFLSTCILIPCIVITGLLPAKILGLISPSFSAYHRSYPHFFSIDNFINSIKVYLIGAGVFFVYLKKDLAVSNNRKEYGLLQRLNIPWALFIGNLIKGKKIIEKLCQICIEVCIFVFNSLRVVFVLLDRVFSFEEDIYRSFIDSIYHFLYTIFSYADRLADYSYSGFTSFLTGVYHRGSLAEGDIHFKDRGEDYKKYKNIIVEIAHGHFREAGRRLRGFFKEKEYKTFNLNIGVMIFATMIVVFMLILSLYVPLLVNGFAAY